jgi:hypothetical protein
VVHNTRAALAVGRWTILAADEGVAAVRGASRRMDQSRLYCVWHGPGYVGFLQGAENDSTEKLGVGQKHLG